MRPSGTLIAAWALALAACATTDAGGDRAQLLLWTGPGPAPGYPATDWGNWYLATASGRLTRRLDVFGGATIVLSPDGTQTAMLFFGDVRLTDLGSGAVVDVQGPEGVPTPWLAWSPDGTRVLYGLTNQASDSAWFVVLPIDGTAARVIPTNRAGAPPNGGYFSWSPDGQRFAYSDGFRVHVLNADGSGFRTLTTAPAPTGGTASGCRPVGIIPSWSPDGTRIAYAECGILDIKRRIVHVAVDGGDRRVVTSAEFWSSQPTWTSDGKHIVYQRLDGPPGNEGELRIVDADGTHDRVFLDQPGTECCLSWARRAP